MNKLGDPELDEEKLRAEVLGLFQYIQRFREEIAHMIKPDGEGDKTHFNSISDQLDEIIAATENATNLILEGMEKVDTITAKLRETEDVADIPALCDELEQASMNTMEACTFQDITGQRVTKIMRSMEFVEQRVDSMLQLWGRSHIEEMAKVEPKKEERTGDAALLNGPALPTETAISQAEIDALFD